MKINNISVSNYRFFKDIQKFDFGNNNILLYGENGSGKTSLYNAFLDFFFYYKNPNVAKEKIEKNKNIFPKVNEAEIAITFEDNTTIKFNKDGLNKEDLKENIEEVSKSKLFLTYQDIYALNNIFKKDISYKEFKEIFIILYFDDLSNKFDKFESSKKDFENKLNDITDSEIILDYNEIRKLIDNFDFDLLDNELLSIIDEDNNIQVAYFLPKEKFIEMEKSFKKIEFFIEFCDTLNIEIKDDFWVRNEVENITEKVSTLLEENNRFEIFNSNILKSEDFEGKTSLDELLKSLDSYTQIIHEYTEATYSITDINNTIFGNLEKSIGKINDILNFLDINIRVEEIVEKDYLHYTIEKFNIYSVDFKVEVFNTELKSHWSNLNEAKLSALNLAIYFSSILGLGKKPNIPILILDDLLISLDMSNRDKILNLLFDRTLDENDNPIFFDDDYQMFIFTHDRAFFELAKYKFDNKAKDKWSYLEMYEDTSRSYPQPLVMPSESKLEKAESYFKIGDYPTSGSYLRKASEEILKKKIIDTYLKEVEKPTLDPLIKLYKKMLTDFTFEIPHSIFELEDLTKRVLNPSSHDDLLNPLYKKEINDAITVVKEINDLHEIQMKKIITGGSILLYELENKYKVRFNFLKDVNLYIYDTNIGNRRNTYLGNCGYAIYEDDNWNNKYYDGFSTFTLKKAFEVVSFSVNKDCDIKIDEDGFIGKLKINNSLLDEDIISFIKKQIS